MIRFKKYVLIALTAFMATSCSDFLDTVPYDALSPSLTWKDEADATKFLTGLYDGWEDASALIYWDCGSDFGYNNFPWEGLTNIGNGTMTASAPGWGFYDFSKIRSCNDFLKNVDKCAFNDEAVRTDMKSQARFIRAYRYFVMNWNYGGVPIIDNYVSADEAMVPRESEAKVRAFIEEELDDILKPGNMNERPSQRGRIAKGAAYALRMRVALYYEDWAKAVECAEEIMKMGYSLDPDYSNVFKVSGQNSPEIILAMQHILGTYSFYTIGQLYNNADGGWSSVVPTENLVNTYEMKNGLTIDDPNSGYDPVHPFKDRDPRMAMSIIYPGRDYIKSDGSVGVFNTLDKTLDGKNNANYFLMANNSSKTGLTWAKYLDPITQYADIWDTNCCPIVFRYAEVLLSYAEAANELNAAPTDKVYDCIDALRQRAGMPLVDRQKYNTKESMRELIRRERGVELAGEGLRRADIMRWKDAQGQPLAMKVLNGSLNRMIGTVSMDASIPEGERATINTAAGEENDKLRKIEDRVFNAYNRYLPIPQGNIDANPNLVQNPGYGDSEQEEGK